MSALPIFGEVKKPEKAIRKQMSGIVGVIFAELKTGKITTDEAEKSMERAMEVMLRASDQLEDTTNIMTEAGEGYEFALFMVRLAACSDISGIAVGQASSILNLEDNYLRGDLVKSGEIAIMRSLKWEKEVRTNWLKVMHGNPAKKNAAKVGKAWKDVRENNDLIARLYEKLPETLSSSEHSKKLKKLLKEREDLRKENSDRSAKK